MDIIVALRVLEFPSLAGDWVQNSVIIWLRANCPYGVVRGIFFDGDGSFWVEVL